MTRLPYGSATSTFYLLSHFSSLQATKMWQQSYNLHQSKINSIPWKYICTVVSISCVKYIETYEMQLIFLCFVVTFCSDIFCDSCLVVANVYGNHSREID